MSMEDWEIGDGHATFVFYDDGAYLQVEVCCGVEEDLIYHGAGGRHYEKTVKWFVDDYFLVNEAGLPVSDNAGMAEFYYGATVKNLIETKLKKELL